MGGWHGALGVVAGLISMFAVVPYIKDALRGTTRPNIFSFVLWAVMLFISIVAQFSAGASWSVALLIGDFIGTSSIVVLCLAGYGYATYGWLEWVCTVLAVVAIASWQFAQQPVLAICFAVLADLLAGIPTFAKAYRDPWSEEPSQWLLIAFAAALSVASSTIINFANLLFPAYLLAMNGLIGTLALVGRRFVKKPAAL